MKDKKPRERMTFSKRKARGKLALDKSAHEDASFAFRWASDRPGRIAELEDAGYERDSRTLTGGTVRHGGSHEDGSDMKMVLMRQRREDYDEDAQAKREMNEDLMAQIKDKALEGGAAKEVGGIDKAHARMTESTAEIEVG